GAGIGSNGAGPGRARGDHHRRPTGARPGHRGIGLAKAAWRPAPCRACPARLDHRGRGADHGARGARLHAPRAPHPAVVAVGLGPPAAGPLAAPGGGAAAARRARARLAGMAALMLVLEAVTYRYAGAPRPSLHEVSLELREGEVLGIVGASEAGKTTLCLVASGLAPRTVGGTLTGRLLLDGADTAPLAMHDLAWRIGIAFASPTTQLSGVAASVYEEVAFGPMNLGVPRPELIAR